MTNRSAKPNEEQGSIKSYVIGFILSLLFTLIPYYLVTNQTVAGNQLLITIVIFAMVQMVIQVTFFLHLGRGPKPRWNLFFFLATAGLVALVVSGSIIIINNLHYNMSPSDKVAKIANDENIYQIGGQETGACRELLVNHKVTISNGLVNPSYTSANKCDTLTFINEDSDTREISFGEHDHHGVYAGVTEVEIKPGRSERFCAGSR